MGSSLLVHSLILTKLEESGDWKSVFRTNRSIWLNPMTISRMKCNLGLAAGLSTPPWTTGVRQSLYAKCTTPRDLEFIGSAATCTWITWVGTCKRGAKSKEFQPQRKWSWDIFSNRTVPSPMALTLELRALFQISCEIIMPHKLSSFPSSPHLIDLLNSFTDHMLV